MQNILRIWLGYGILALVAIPWYWHWIPAANTLVFGVPAWVVSAITGSALISCYTAWLLSHPWPGELPDGSDR